VSFRCSPEHLDQRRMVLELTRITAGVVGIDSACLAWELDDMGQVLGVM
jgi:hypothetical protein